MKINKHLLFLFKLAVSSIALYMVFSKTDIRKILGIIRDSGPLYLLAAAGLYIVALFVSALRWRLLLQNRFPVGKLFALNLMGAFFSSFLPGAIGGDAVKAYYLNKDTNSMGMTLASVFMDRYFGYVSLMILGMSCYPFAYHLFGDSQYRWAMPIIFVSFVMGSFVFFGLKFGRKFRGVADFYDYFELIGKRKDIMIKAVLLSSLVQFISFSGVGLLAWSIGEHVPFVLLLVLLPIIGTIIAMPISIAGLGVREAAFVVLLGLIGVKPEMATCISLLWFFSIFIGSIPGIAAYIFFTGKSGAVPPSN